MCFRYFFHLATWGATVHDVNTAVGSVYVYSARGLLGVIYKIKDQLTSHWKK